MGVTVDDNLQKIPIPRLIESIRLLPGTKDVFKDRDISDHAKSMYRALLRSATIKRKVDPTLTNTFRLDGKQKQAQIDLGVIKGKLEEAEVAGAHKLAADVEATPDVAHAEVEWVKAKVESLKKRNADLLADAWAAVKATKDALKA
ncbi:hypothetical protein AHAS_Ahas04G0116900 [Arachis hypogaea]